MSLMIQPVSLIDSLANQKAPVVASLTQNEWLTILAIFLSPIIPVLISLWYQGRTSKKSAKRNLFLTIMAHRKELPPSPEWVNSLNLIDVIFEEDADVTKAWHTLHDYLNDAKAQADFDPLGKKYIALLSLMAKSLGYNVVQQIDIDSFYSPNAYGMQLLKNNDIQDEFLRVLKNTESLSAKPKEVLEQKAGKE